MRKPSGRATTLTPTVIRPFGKALSAVCERERLNSTCVERAFAVDHNIRQKPVSFALGGKHPIINGVAQYVFDGRQKRFGDGMIMFFLDVRRDMPSTYSLDCRRQNLQLIRVLRECEDGTCQSFRLIARFLR